MKGNEYKRRLIILFFIGFLIGGIVAYFLRYYYMDSYYAYFDEVVSSIQSGTIHYGYFFVLALKRILVPALLLLVLSTTYVFPYVCVMGSIFCGFQIGYFVQSLFFSYHLPGLLYAILSGVPQLFLYVPLFYFIIRYGYEGRQLLHKKKSLTEKLLPLGMLLVLMLTGVFLETFVNSFIMRHVLFLVS